MEVSQQLSDMWLENLKELIGSQRSKISQMRVAFERVKSENTSLKVKLNDREQKIYQLEKQLRSQNAADKSSNLLTSKTSCREINNSEDETHLSGSITNYGLSSYDKTSGLENNDLPITTNFSNTSSKKPIEDTIKNFMEYSLDIDAIESKAGKPVMRNREKNHKCAICNKFYTNLHGLKQHMKIHGDEAVECEICGKKFGRSYNLRRHMMTHTGEKPHQCRVCLKQFSGKGTLKQHMASHSETREHRCHLCSKVYKTRGDLSIHVRKHEPPRFDCHLCARRFHHKKDLNYHVKKHALKEAMEKSSWKPQDGSQEEAPMIQLGSCKDENVGDFEEDPESVKSFGERASFEGVSAESGFFGGKSGENAATDFEPGLIEFDDFEKRLKNNAYETEGVEQ